MIPLALRFPNLLGLTEKDWPALIAVVAGICVLVLVYRALVTKFGPADLTGSGITIGAPKIFDNRSLTSMIEGLNANLQTFNVVSPDVAKQLGAFQEGESVSTGNRLQLAARAAASDKSQSDAKSGAAASPSAFNFSPSFGVGAPDTLGDQLNLTYQIFNQRIVNERALSDRVYGNGARMQVVLGFQVSIDPPDGSQDCAAVAEIGLEFAGSGEPISIVALIPQEKTYNAASLSSRANSIDGSVVSPLMKIGGGASRQADRVYLHRDADTIAFERDPSQESGAFGLRKPKEPPPPTVFGWEFHPVLGRRTVSPGTRLMLAVIALPCSEDDKATLQVKTRAYWLTYNRKRQTTNVRWAWWPYPSRQGRVPKWSGRNLDLVSPLQIQALVPKIEKISWVDAGSGTAVILVNGRNFFSGTEVIIGGKVHSTKDTGLILKSDRALQVQTTVEAFAQGNAVLSGRFGPSIELAYEFANLPADGIKIENAQFLPTPSEYTRLFVLIRSVGGKKPVLCDVLRELPDPVLYVNDQPLPRPYDYEDWSSKWMPYERGPDPQPLDAVRVMAWSPADLLQAGAVLLFKVPFCGTDWAARIVLQSTESLQRAQAPPKLERFGTEGDQTIFLIEGHDFDANQKWVAWLDSEYPLQVLNSRALLLSVSSAVLSNFSKLVLTNAKVNLILDIPRDAERPAAAVPKTEKTETGRAAPLP